MLSLPQAREMVRASDLNMTQRFVLMAVASYTNGSPACWPSITELAEVTNADPRTVQRALAELEERCYITITPQAGRCNTYRVTAHPAFPEEELQALQHARGDTVPPPAERRPEEEDLVHTSGPLTREVEVVSPSPRHSAGGGTAPGVREARPDPVQMSEAGARSRWRKALVASGELRQNQKQLPQRVLQAVKRGELPDGSTFAVPNASPVAAATFVREQGSERSRYPSRAERLEQQKAAQDDVIQRTLAERRAQREGKA